MKKYQEHIYEIGYPAWEEAPQNFFYSEKIYSEEEFDDICYKILTNLLIAAYFDRVDSYKDYININIDIDDVYYEFIDELEKVGFERIKSRCAFYVNGEDLVGTQGIIKPGSNVSTYNKKTDILRDFLNKNIKKQKLNKKLKKIK